MRERFNDLAEQATDSYNVARDATFRGVRSAYNTAREYPGTIAAIVVGVGIASFLLWAARRAGGWRNLQADALDRARQGYDYARDGYGRAREVIRDRVSRYRSEEPEQLS
jgi:uncharacterized membrane protein YccC